MLRLSGLLLEILLESLPTDVLSHKIKNPHAAKTGREEITVGWALRFPQNDAAYIAAKQYLMKFAGTTSADVDNLSTKSSTQATTQTSQSATSQTSNVSISQPSPSEIEELKSRLDVVSEFRIILSSPDGGPPESYNKFYVQNALNDPDAEHFREMENYLRKVTGIPDLTMGAIVKLAFESAAMIDDDADKRIELTFNEMEAAYEGGDRITEFEINCESKDRNVGVKSSFVLYPDNPSNSYLYAGLVSNTDLSKGSGGLRPSAPKLLKHAISACDALGISSIKFEAGLTAGGYIWAKMGAIPDKQSIKELLTSDVWSANDRVPEGRLHRMIDNIRQIAEKLDEGKQLTAGELLGNRRFGGTFDEEENKKLVGKIIRDVQKAKNTGTFEQEMEVLDILLKKIEEDPSLISAIANHEFGRYILQGCGWQGSFNIENGSSSREFILANL